MPDSEDDWQEQILAAMMPSGGRGHDADYLRRGRSFEHASVDDLTTTWTTAFHMLLGEPSDGSRQMFADLNAEFRLRKQPVPFDLIGPELEILRSKIAAAGPYPSWVRQRIEALQRSRGHPEE